MTLLSRNGCPASALKAIPVVLLGSAALLLASCGATETAADGSADAPIPEQLAATSGDGTLPPGAATDPEILDEPDRAQTPAAMPSFELIDAVLADFTLCLNRAGAGVEDIGLEQMMVKLPDLPATATRSETFSFFYGRDHSEPVIGAAIEACSGILDDPAVAAFIPAE